MTHSPLQKAKAALVMFDCVPPSWTKAECKTIVDQLDNNLYAIGRKVEANEKEGVFDFALDSRAIQIAQWIHDLEEAMKTR